MRLDVFLSFLSTLLIGTALGHPTNWIAKPDVNNAPGSVRVNLERNHKFKRNGPAEYAQALLKYGVKLPGHLTQFASADKYGVSSVAAQNQTADKEYLSPTLIGSPGQPVLLDFDTGSSDLWLFSPSTQALGFPLHGLSARDARQVYNPNVSSSATLVDGSSWSIFYGDGSFAGGQVWKDDILLGDLRIPQVPVETADAVSPSMAKDPAISGLLGLSWNHSNTIEPKAPSFLNLLAPQLQEKVFTTDLKYHAEGTYDFGKIDASKYKGNISFQPIIPDSQFWQFYMQGYHVESNDTWIISDWEVIADTGTTLMLMPDSILEAYYYHVPGAVNRPSMGGWLVPCNSTDSLPDFSFKFNDDMVVTVPGLYMNYEEVTPGSTMCYGGAQSNQGLLFSILGDVFLKSCFMVFDIANAQVGIALKDLVK